MRLPFFSEIAQSLQVLNLILNNRYKGNILVDDVQSDLPLRCPVKVATFMFHKI